MKPFKCDRCGYCCTLTANISWFDIFRIIRNTNYKYSDFVVKDMAKKKCIKQKKNKDCLFLIRRGKTTACKVYEHRPKVCREYPGFEEGTCISKTPDIKEYLRKLSSKKL